MTVSTATSRVDYTGNGVTTVFSVPFPFIDDTYLQVIRTIVATGVETTLVLNSGGADGYTVSGAGQATGSVTVVTAPSGAQRLSIIRAVPGTQEADFVANDPFPAETFEDSLDKLQMQINDNATRAIRSPVLFDSDIDGSGRYNSNGNRYADAADGVNAQDLVTVGQLGNATNANAPFVQGGAGAVSRTVQSKLRDVVSVKDFGAVGDGVVDDTVAMKAAIAYAETLNGAQVYLPAGVYLTSDTLTLSARGTAIVGDGAARSSTGEITPGSSGVVGTAARVGASRIYADFTSGPVLRLKSQGHVLRDFVVDASPTRKAASLSDNYGIHIEGDDTAGGSTKGFLLYSVKVQNQPSHGIVAVNDMVNSRMDMCDATHCNGHGIVIAGGAFTGRTNKTRPGQVQINNARVHRTGGHSLLVGGDEPTTNDVPYRVEINNIEAFYNLIDPSLAIDPANPANAYISGENHTLDASAFDGRSEFPTISDTHTGLFLRGRVIRVRNFRAIDTAPYCIDIGDHTLLGSPGTQSVHIDGLLISNQFRGAGYFNPAVRVASGCRDTRVWLGRNSTLVTQLMTRGTQYDEYNAGTRTTDIAYNLVGVSADRVRADLFRSQDEFTIADDAAGYFEFAAGARGAFIISGNTSGSKYAMAHFRCGDANAHVTLMNSSSGVTGTTGTLNGTTGADGNLTIAADTVTNRLYVENRTGSARSYTVTFLGVNGAAQSVGNFT